MKPVHEDIAQILEPTADDRFACPKEIRKKAMDFLARREYGQAELVRKLVDKGYVLDIVEDEVRRLADENLQCDTRFAESFVTSRIGRGKGPVRIRAELSERLLPPAIIDAAIEAADVDWYALAAEIRAAKFGAAAPADFPEKARQMRFLQYRGFESDHIQSAF